MEYCKPCGCDQDNIELELPIVMAKATEGVTVHIDLEGRDDPDQHPISAITDLEERLQSAGLVKTIDTLEPDGEGNVELTWEGTQEEYDELPEEEKDIPNKDYLITDADWNHFNLTGRAGADSHPIPAITGLVEALAAAGGVNTVVMTQQEWDTVVEEGRVSEYIGYYVVISGAVDPPEVLYIPINNIRINGDGVRAVATDVGVKTITRQGKAIEIQEFYSSVDTGAATSKTNTFSTDGLVFKPISDTEIQISTEKLDEKIAELVSDLEPLLAALPMKANIFERLAIGIGVGNNIKGCHIEAKSPFMYTNDWAYLTDNSVKLVRTNNTLVYTDANGVDTTIVADGTVLVPSFIITDEFYITSVTGSPVNINLIYRWFDMPDIDQRIGLLSSLETQDRSSIVSAINSLFDRVSDLLSSTELEGSPFQSYADFIAMYPEVDTGKYAYVTFVETDTIPPTWNCQVGETWRLDGGLEEFHPTSNMTTQFTITLTDGSSTNELPTAGNHPTPQVIQTYRDNLKYVINQLAAHTANTENPHSVTATQVGLGSVNNTADTDKPVSTAQAAAIATRQAAITTTGATNLLTAPESSGGNPGSKAINTLLAAPAPQTASTQILLAPSTQGAAPTLKAVTDFLSAPTAQTANAQILLAPSVQGAVPTFKAVTDLMASPAAQTASTQILVAPATKGNAPTLLPIAPIVQRTGIASAANGTYTILNDARRIIQFTTMGSGSGRRFIRLYKVNTDGYNKGRLVVTSRYIWSTQDIVWSQATANTAPTLIQGGMQWDSAITRFHLFLGNDGYMWIDYDTNDLGGMKLILDVTADDQTRAEVQFTSNVPTAVGGSVDLRAQVVRKTFATANGLTFSYQRSGNVVYCQCSGNQLTAGIASYGTMATIPVGYRPSIQSPTQDSIYHVAAVNTAGVNRPVGFQLYTGLVRPMEALANASYVIAGWSWITDDAWTM